MIRLTVEETNLLSIYNEGGKRALIDFLFRASVRLSDRYRR
ncbi:transposon-transfer assisting family protein [Neglectibacter sp. X58]